MGAPSSIVWPRTGATAPKRTKMTGNNFIGLRSVNGRDDLRVIMYGAAALYT